MNTHQDLTDYLSTAQDAAPEAMLSAVDPTATIVAVAEPPEDKVAVLLSKLCAIGWLSKDLHYRAKDKSFYGNHLLADLIYYVTSKGDDLKEVYYLGEKETPPPRGVAIADRSVRMLSMMNQTADPDEKDIANSLLLFLESAIREVERIKDSEQLLSGTVAVLDGISEELLKDAGLLRRVVAPEDKTDKPDGVAVIEVAAEPVAVPAVPEDPITAYLEMDKDGETE